MIDSEVVTVEFLRDALRWHTMVALSQYAGSDDQRERAATIGLEYQLEMEAKYPGAWMEQLFLETGTRFIPR